MKHVSTITGGAGGMGQASAQLVGRTHRLVLADIRTDRLELTVQELADQGIEATAAHCDITDVGAVTELFDTATRLGGSPR